MDLTKIEKPIALLDDVTKTALFAHGGPYQVVGMFGGWVDCSHKKGSHEFDYYMTYRVKPGLRAFAVVQKGRIIAMTTDKDHAAYCKSCSAGSTIVELEEK